jgi:hypothetical protein
MSNTPYPGDRGRFSFRRKTDAVLRLLRGEDLELLSRVLGVTAATLSGWRDDFLAGGQAALKSRPADERDDEIARLRANVGELCGAGTWVAPGAGTWVTLTGPVRFYNRRDSRRIAAGTHRTRCVA